MAGRNKEKLEGVRHSVSAANGAAKVPVSLHMHVCLQSLQVVSLAVEHLHKTLSM